MRQTGTSRWQKFWHLPSHEKGLLLRASILFAVTGVCLRVAGFRKSKRLLERLDSSASRPATSSRDEGIAAAARVTQIVSVAERWSFNKPTCLERSLVLWQMLRHQHLPAQLHIGARKNEHVLEAHAWVECSGVVLNDTADVHKHYSRFDGPIADEEAETR